MDSYTKSDGRCDEFPLRELLQFQSAYDDLLSEFIAPQFPPVAENQHGVHPAFNNLVDVLDFLLEKNMIASGVEKRIDDFTSVHEVIQYLLMSIPGASLQEGNHNTNS